MPEAQKQDELRAMQDIVKRLEAMSEDERRRTMTFLHDRYGHLLGVRGVEQPQNGSLRDRVGGQR